MSQIQVLPSCSALCYSVWGRSHGIPYIPLTPLPLKGLTRIQTRVRIRTGLCTSQRIQWEAGALPPLGLQCFGAAQGSFASSDMLIDAYFWVSPFSRLSGELLPLCDLPWEFNSNCDHTSTDKMRAGTQQSAWRDAGRFIEDFFSGLKRAAVSGSREILSSSSVQTKTSFRPLNIPPFFRSNIPSDTLDRVLGDFFKCRVEENHSWVLHPQTFFAFIAS